MLGIKLYHISKMDPSQVSRGVLTSLEQHRDNNRQKRPTKQAKVLKIGHIRHD